MKSCYIHVYSPSILSLNELKFYNMSCMCCWKCVASVRRIVMRGVYMSIVDSK